MSREIKFRAWDGEKIVYDVQNYHYPSFGEWCGIKSVIIEQYTGLNDKNGKEIYERDIVKQLIYESDGKKIYTTWQVKWNDNECCFDMRRVSGALYGDSMLSSDNTEKYEVIGNIHENPELLESKKGEKNDYR